MVDSKGVQMVDQKDFQQVGVMVDLKASMMESDLVAEKAAGQAVVQAELKVEKLAVEQVDQRVFWMVGQRVISKVVGSVEQMDF